MGTHWIICSLHLGCRSPSQSSFTPGSPRSLLLRSILTKFLLAIRAAVRSWQAELETRQLFSLGRKGEKSQVIPSVVLLCAPSLILSAPPSFRSIFPFIENQRQEISGCQGVGVGWGGRLELGGRMLLLGLMKMFCN